MNIGIFCSANDIDERYMKPARKLAALLAERGHTIIYGGAEYGVMKAIADAAQVADGKVVAMTTELFKEWVDKRADEIVLSKDLAARRLLMLERSDVIVVTPGGIGTIDELTEALALKKQGDHDKPVVVLNTDGFYDGLQTQMQRIADEGFLPVGGREGIFERTLDQFMQFMDTPEEVMELIDAYALSAAEVPKSNKKAPA